MKMQTLLFLFTMQIDGRHVRDRGGRRQQLSIRAVRRHPVATDKPVRGTYHEIYLQFLQLLFTEI